ncbi:MAG: hypothetical protein Q8R60_00400 [Mycobacteriales bacterium]|nr:hypothetical protein [Mycobacteriales bacterium]
MSLSEELRDPWGLVVAGVAGGLAWAFAAPVAAAVAVGAGVYGAKVLTGVLTGSGGEAAPARRPALPRPPKGSPPAYWLERAEGAVRSLDALARTASTGAAGDAVRSAATDAGRTLDELLRVAAQVTAVVAAESRVDLHGLDGEAERLEQRARAATNPEQAAELRRSSAAVRDRLAVAARLDEARDTLLARMEATALGLEGLVARLAEVLALTATSGGVDTSAAEIAELATELDGLREGLAETEALSRRALGQADPPPP